MKIKKSTLRKLIKEEYKRIKLSETMDANPKEVWYDKQWGYINYHGAVFNKEFIENLAKLVSRNPSEKKLTSGLKKLDKYLSQPGRDKIYLSDDGQIILDDSEWGKILLTTSVIERMAKLTKKNNVSSYYEPFNRDNPRT